MDGSTHLNRAQLRVQSMKSEFQNREISHLHSFIDGISKPEPPVYRNVEGVVSPSLAYVSLKIGVDRYDFGNVSFRESVGGGTKRVWVVVAKGEIEANTMEAIPRSKGNPMSVAIDDEVFMFLLDLLKAKFEAIDNRIRQINETRRLAYNAPNISHPTISYGQNFKKLQYVQAKDSGATLGTLNTRKREIGEPMQRHSTNKRKKIGLALIPDSVKSDAFNRIPENAKLALFDSVANVAFPNIDNMLVAAWNVVSIYQTVGSEFPSLHKAVLELKGSLVETDNAYGLVATVSSPREERHRERGESHQTEGIHDHGATSTLDKTQHDEYDEQIVGHEQHKKDSDGLGNDEQRTFTLTPRNAQVESVSNGPELAKDETINQNQTSQTGRQLRSSRSQTQSISPKDDAAISPEEIPDEEVSSNLIFHDDDEPLSPSFPDLGVTEVSTKLSSDSTLPQLTNQYSETQQPLAGSEDLVGDKEKSEEEKKRFLTEKIRATQARLEALGELHFNPDTLRSISGQHRHDEHRHASKRSSTSGSNEGRATKMRRTSDQRNRVDQHGVKQKHKSEHRRTDPEPSVSDTEDDSSDILEEDIKQIDSDEEGPVTPFDGCNESEAESIGSDESDGSDPSDGETVYLQPEPVFLGTSKLGKKKAPVGTGKAPTAPTTHAGAKGRSTRKTSRK